MFRQLSGTSAVTTVTTTVEVAFLSNITTIESSFGCCIFAVYVFPYVSSLFRNGSPRDCMFCKTISNIDLCQSSSLPITSFCNRFTAIVCLSIPHWVTDDIKTSDGRYHLPANTMIFPNLYHVMNNPEVFPNPRQFNPDRFINANGKFVKHEHNIVFGLGENSIFHQILENY